MSSTFIPALSVFGLAVEVQDNDLGDYSTVVTVASPPRDEEATAFVGHLRALLQAHAGASGVGREDAEVTHAEVLQATLKDLLAMNHYAFESVEGDFWTRMELLGLGVLLHTLSELEPQVLADWWALYANAGGDPVAILEALEAAAV